MKIKEVQVRKIFNSRKEETISVSVKIDKGTVEASAPSGCSRGKHEVMQFSVRGIDYSIALLKKISKKIMKLNLTCFNDLEKVEVIVRKYDKTNNLSVVGGNALYALEASLVKAIAIDNDCEVFQLFLDKKPVMPMPIGNCMGSWEHGSRKTDFQEFLFIPKTKKFIDAHIMNLEAYKRVKKILIKNDKKWFKKPLSEKINYEGAMSTTLSNEEAINIMNEVKESISSNFGNIEIGVDAAASNFFDRKKSKYIYRNFSKKQKIKELTEKEQIKFISELINKKNIFYFEDPLQENDFKGFSEIKKRTKHIICGDDLICTNLERLKIALKTKAIDAVIIKPNQIGSLLETKKVSDMAKENNIVPIISHRSGETLDNFIAQLAVGWQIPFIKISIIGKERLAKSNELIKIERFYT